ncbi:hypothetical protein KDD17_14075 [Sulfitobacter albidus]|uniref:Uncharacterized protein n=1 Tax=Sulfitobacter albidus TaxID=2829501 RepID=A0A975PM45_9RHOB|nr:hypothetical protein [Sulfitobacter albidus]QUJ76041.1 hypothetical protein KDD17_14075 [Sulfitobacter albidus]
MEPDANTGRRGGRSARTDRQTTRRGFCRRAGGRSGCGGHVALLDGAAQVTTGWLDTLTEAIQMYPEAEVVGPKILGFDGLVQCAGLLPGGSPTGAAWIPLIHGSVTPAG